MSLAVVGVDYPNKNKRAPARRFEVAICRPGEDVELRPEPRNPADPRAIAVFSERGVQLGYLTAERCGRIGAIIRSGRIVTAIFQHATPWGAVIRVAFDEETPRLPQISSREEQTEHEEFRDPDYWDHL